MAMQELAVCNQAIDTIQDRIDMIMPKPDVKQEAARGTPSDLTTSLDEADPPTDDELDITEDLRMSTPEAFNKRSARDADLLVRKARKDTKRVCTRIEHDQIIIQQGELLPSTSKHHVTKWDKEAEESTYYATRRVPDWDTAAQQEA